MPPHTPLYAAVPNELRERFVAGGQGHVFKFVDAGLVRKTYCLVVSCYWTSLSGYAL